MEGLCADGDEVVVLNTCSVTQRADSDARRALRRLRRDNPRAVLIVTGCMAQLAPSELKAEGMADYIVSHHELKRFASRQGGLLRQEKAQVYVGNPFKSPSPILETGPLGIDQGRSRAFVKIQDGCDGFCSFCAIPMARGKSRSKPVKNVLDELRALQALGYEEIVLTGIRLSAYGKDLGFAGGLLGLIRAIEESSVVKRLRISSLEPHDLSEAFLAHLKSSSVICPHFHIALQSGDDGVLGLMRRDYDVGEFERVVSWLFANIPDVHVGLDVIVGFPGEDEAAFQKTIRLIERYPFGRLHVFPFSPKKGTIAAKMKDRVPTKIIKERLRLLHELDFEKRASFADSQIGKVRGAIVERTAPEGSLKLKTDNYLDVLVPVFKGLNPKPGRLVPVLLQSRSGLEVYGDIQEA